MDDNEDPPPMDDFVKTLNVMLLIQLAVVMLLYGAKGHAAASHLGALTLVLELVGALALAGSILPNLVTLINTVPLEKRPKHGPYALIAKRLTLLQMTLMLAGFFFADPNTQLATGLLAAAAAAILIAFGKGKFLMPPRPR